MSQAYDDSAVCVCATPPPRPPQHTQIQYIHRNTNLSHTDSLADVLQKTDFYEKIIWFFLCAVESIPLPVCIKFYAQSLCVYDGDDDDELYYVHNRVYVGPILLDNVCDNTGIVNLLAMWR